MKECSESQVDGNDQIPTFKELTYQRRRKRDQEMKGKSWVQLEQNRETLQEEASSAWGVRVPYPSVWPGLVNWGSNSCARTWWELQTTGWGLHPGNWQQRLPPSGSELHKGMWQDTDSKPSPSAAGFESQAERLMVLCCLLACSCSCIFWAAGLVFLPLSG